MKKLIILFLCLKNAFSFQHQIPSEYMNYNRVKLIIKDIYNTGDKRYNLEHIVPQSIFKGNKSLKSDMHNIILYPEKMNLHRSNYEYISDFKLYPNSKFLLIGAEEKNNPDSVPKDYLKSVQNRKPLNFIAIKIH